jgi:hypothetical protein
VRCCEMGIIEWPTIEYAEPYGVDVDWMRCSHVVDEINVYQKKKEEKKVFASS